MGKLNIAHHKSYHPYRADNIERVRRDEEEALKKEEGEEGRMRLADSEARIDLLRQRASGSSSSKKRLARAKDLDDMKKIKDGTQGLIPHDTPEEAVTTLTASSGHINLFASLESTVSGQQLQLMDKKAKEAAAAKEAEKGAPLAPSANDLRPWYTDRDLVGGRERERDKDERAKDRRRLKEVASKSASDPLKSMNAHLARRSEILASGSSSSRVRPNPTAYIPSSVTQEPAVAARLSRESSERARAEALIRRKKAEMEGTESSIGADTPRDYSNVFNERETREAGVRRRGRGNLTWDDRPLDLDRRRW